MEQKININSTLEDLHLFDASLSFSDDLLSIYSIFEHDQNIPGVCLYNSEVFSGLLSRKKFFEIMSKQFMYDLYSKRKIEYFFTKDMTESQLILKGSMKIIDALHMALTRNEEVIYEPLAVHCYPDRYKILDFYGLVLAQNKILGIMNSLLKEANEFKNEVLAIAAHDLRNPLGAIKGFSELIMDLTENKDCKYYADNINKAAVHMEDLVDKFLMSAINDSTELKLHYSVFNIKETVESVLRSLSHLAEEKSQQVIFYFESMNFDIYSDKLKISEVVENLVSNALKYSKQNTCIEITLKRGDSDIQIVIADEGPGFTETDKQKIFGKFQRLSARPTGNESSTGLGLFTVKKIMDKLGGEIMLESEQGKGSRFTLVIRLQEGEREKSLQLKTDE